MLRSRKTFFTVMLTVVFVISSVIFMTVQDRNPGGKIVGKGSGKQLKRPGTTAIDKLISNMDKSGTTAQILQQNPTVQNMSQGKRPDFKGIKVRAIYLSGASAGDSDIMKHIIQLVKTTELNAVVIDIKENGVVNYRSDIPEVKENKLYTQYYKPDSLIKQLHENNIFVIGRIVCFRDPGLASRRVDLAIKTPGGAIWKEGSIAWTNPYKREVWNYNINIAKEAANKGFDEIQFDYVRFPTASKSEVAYGNNIPSKADAICGFLLAAEKELRDEKGIPVTADTFGIICESELDGENIGQVLERIGKDIDYICPMVYPSHYANASHGAMGNGTGQVINGVKFTAPDLEPYKVVYNTLIKVRERISKVKGYRAKVRPYLQNFTASYIKNKDYYQVYGAKQVREQIQAVYDAGYDEWILWSGRNTYSENALKPE
jgi:hypothetical protein